MEGGREGGREFCVKFICTLTCYLCVYRTGKSTARVCCVACVEPFLDYGLIKVYAVEPQNGGLADKIHYHTVVSAPRVVVFLSCD